MQAEKDFEMGGYHGFVIRRSTAVDISVFDHRREWIYCPLGPLHSHNVKMGQQQKGALLTVTLQAGDDVATPGRRFVDLGGDSLFFQNNFEVLATLGLVSWRIAGIYLDQCGEKLCTLTPSPEVERPHRHTSPHTA